GVTERGVGCVAGVSVGQGVFRARRSRRGCARDALPPKPAPPEPAAAKASPAEAAAAARILLTIDCSEEFTRIAEQLFQLLLSVTGFDVLALVRIVSSVLLTFFRDLPERFDDSLKISSRIPQHQLVGLGEGQDL